MKPLGLAMSLVVLATMPACASVPAVAKKQQLHWPVRNELLVYRSCGCADSCWVAEVRGARTGALKSRLRCDCERLYFQRSPHAGEQLIADSCDSINGSGSKFDSIPGKLQELRGGESIDAVASKRKVRSR